MSEKKFIRKVKSVRKSSSRNHPFEGPQVQEEEVLEEQGKCFQERTKGFEEIIDSKEDRSSTVRRRERERESWTKAKQETLIQS